MYKIETSLPGLFYADFDIEIPILGTRYLGAQISEKLSF